MEEMKPETTEEHKTETLKPSRVRIRGVAKQKTVSGLPQDNFNEDG